MSLRPIGAALLALAAYSPPSTGSTMTPEKSLAARRDVATIGLDPQWPRIVPNRASELATGKQQTTDTLITLSDGAFEAAAANVLKGA